MKPILIPIGVCLMALIILAEKVTPAQQTNPVTPKAIVTDGKEWRIVQEDNTLGIVHYPSLAEAEADLEAHRDRIIPGHWTNR